MWYCEIVDWVFRELLELVFAEVAWVVPVRLGLVKGTAVIGAFRPRLLIAISTVVGRARSAQDELNGDGMGEESGKKLKLQESVSWSCRLIS